MKGTRTQPQCGFSYKMLQLLNESKADFEVVNVLDDVHNPGLRDAIKTYSQWPTIPQVTRPACVVRHGRCCCLLAQSLSSVDKTVSGGCCKGKKGMHCLPASAGCAC